MATDFNVWAWSATAPGNDTADGSINWAEGQDPATVNNSARGMMAATKRWANVNSGNVAVGGSANAITITTGQTISSGHQALGFRVCFKASADNTGATTVAVDGLSAVAIKRPNGDALSAGDIQSGGFHDIAFDGTNYKLLVPGVGGASGTLTGSNTWSGTNIFQAGATIGDVAGDAVVIKGTSVSSFTSGMFSNSSASAWRTDLGLTTGTSGATIPLLNGANTWSADQTFNTTGSGHYSVNAKVNSTGSVPVRTENSATSGTVYHTQHYHYSAILPGIAFVGGIRGTAGVATLEYFSASDRRLKDNIGELDNAGAVLDRIQPRRFTWKGTTVEDVGFIADELQDVIPGMVDGDRNGDRMQTIAPDKLIPFLVAEIKALRARVAALEAG